MSNTNNEDIPRLNEKIERLVDAYFEKKYTLYRHLHNSYNELIVNLVNYLQTNENLFDENRIDNLLYKYRFKFSNMYIRPPLHKDGITRLYPHEARDLNLTYSLKIIGNIEQIQEIYDLSLEKTISVKVVGIVESTTILILPCMIRSKYCSLSNSNAVSKDCEYDPGGYFIVNGSEKIVLCLERMINNKPIVFYKKDGDNENYKVKINSKSNNTNIMMQTIEIYIDRNININIKVPILNEVSVFVLMRALGLESDKEIMNYIVYNNEDKEMINILRLAIDNSKKDGKKIISSKEDAVLSLINKLRVVKKNMDKDKKLQQSEKKEHLFALLRNAFMPHMDSSKHNDVLKDKAIFLGYMINKLLNSYLKRKDYSPDDRDSFENKRIDTPGDLILELTKQNLKKNFNDCNKFFKKRSGSNHAQPTNIISRLKASNIEQGIKSAMMTGNWGKRKGVAQMYQRLTFLQAISFLRRVDSSSGSSSATMKLTGPRHYHASQVGFLCLTGDTEILMDDRTIKLIKDVKDGDYVTTLDTNTMKELTTPIKNWFKKDCNELLKITTISGREIKCTPEHKLLTKIDDKFQMIEANKMTYNNYLVVRNSQKHLDNEKSNIEIEYINYINECNKDNNYYYSNYEDFVKDTFINDDLLLIKIKNITNIDPEPVYDFETEHSTHNFIANSIISSNCAIESPEHANIGLVKNMTMMGTILTTSKNEVNLTYDQVITSKNFIHINNYQPAKLSTLTKIFLDGEWIGFTENPILLRNELLKMKRNNIFLNTNGVIFNLVMNEIRINADSGRLSRPLLLVENNELVVTPKMIDSIMDNQEYEGMYKWDIFMTHYPDAIEYVDMEEQFYHLVATKIEKLRTMKDREKLSFPDSENPIVNRYDESLIEYYSHCEFDQSLLMGIIAANIPFSNHNFGSRNIYQYAQGKQAMSLYASNYKIRFDISLILYNSQKPLVNTRAAAYIHTDILTYGENCNVMVGCYSGYNQDDSIIMNQTAVDKGMFTSISLKKWDSKIERNQSTAQEDIFIKPDISKLIGSKHANYDKINDKGFVDEETVIENGDVIIGKVTPIQHIAGSNKHYKDSSTIYKSHETAIIDKVTYGIENQEGYGMIKIRTRSPRIPKIGDKFCMPIDSFDVLTQRGWLKLDEISLDDKIATLSNNKLVYDHPIGIYKFGYKGKMYKVRSQQVDIDVTVDHKLYVKKRDHKNFELIDAIKMYGKRYKFKKNCENYEMPEIETIDIDGNNVSYDAYLDLLGMFIADGCISNDKLYIAGEKERKIIRIKETCEKLKVKVKFNKNKNTTLNNLNLGCSHIIESEELLKLLEPLNVGTLNKYLPDYVWNLNMRQARVLLNSLILCDGSKNKQGSECYYTSSKELANDVMKLAIHAGWSGSIKTIRKEGSEYNIKGKKGTITADALSVRIIKTKNEPEINHGHIHEQETQLEEIYDYDGIVGCLEVPSHVFMIRQNNKNVWTGNCCYTSDHEVLTTDGWKFINKITKEDKIASLMDGDILEYHNPTELQEYTYNDELYKIKSNQIDLVVTKNHRMYVGPERGDGEYKIIEAKYLYGKQRRYKKNIENFNPIKTITHINFKAKKEEDKLSFEIEPWLTFFGIWIAEGCTLRTWGVSFATHKPRVKEALEKCCAEMNLEIRKHKDKANDDVRNAWCINNKKLVKYFKKLSVGAINKSLPEWVWRLNREQCRMLIAGMMLGDGHTMENGTERYDTSSTRLADDFQRLCLHAGWSCNKIIKYNAGHESTVKGTGEVIKSTVDAYRLTIIKSQNNPLVNKNITKNGENRHDSYVTFDDPDLQNCIKNKVYCCTVPGKGIIYVKRNGYTAWCGQSRHGQKGVIGLTLRESDMPFTRHGMTPDIILNPHALPSRMTVAHIMECIYGKVAAFKGIECDATPFKKRNLELVFDQLEKMGFRRDGTEYFYSGITGERILSPFYYGPTYYQRLKHLVSDKIHCLRADVCEVLTEKGWKKYGEFTTDDKVATLIDNKLVYEYPKNIFYYPDFNDELYHISNKNIELDVTLEHRMWVSKNNNEELDDWEEYNFEYAKDIIGKTVSYKQNCEWEIFNISTTMIDCIIPFINDDLILDKHNNFILDINNIINKYGELPKWCFALSKERTNMLINSLELTKKSLIESYFVTCNEKFADQIQHLCLHAGLVGIKTKINSNENIWQITIKKPIDTIINSKYNQCTTEKEKVYNYKGAVFCIEVSSGVFMVRQNGKPCWTGNSRARGPVTMLTRQPPEGRSKEGGFRCGEMERDTIISYGLSKFLKERFVDVADKYSCFVCDLCGLFAQRIIKEENSSEPSKNDSYICICCNNKTKITKIIIPYAFKLLIQELMCINIAPRIITKKYDF
jgi:DNA-directed RNA polymerase beta subunit/intein/homing endonuclease